MYMYTVYMLQILINHKFCICRFAYSLICICNQYSQCFPSYSQPCAGQWKVGVICTFPVKLEQDNTLPSCFSSDTVNKHLFHGLFSAMFSAFLCFLLVNSLFKMAFKGNAEGLSSIPKSKKDMMYLTEKNMCAGEAALRHELYSWP